MDEQIKVDGYDKAIIGICCITNRLVYSIDKMVDVYLVNYYDDNGDYDDEPTFVAIDYILFNIVGAYVGEMTPIFIYDYNAEMNEWIYEL